MSSSPLEFDFSGNFKSIVAQQNLKQTGVFEKDTVRFAEERLRLGVTAQKGWIRMEGASQFSLFIQNENPTLLPVPDLNPKSVWETRSRVAGGNSWELIHRIDRAVIQLHFGGSEILVGKQVIPTGTGHIFSAVSQTPRHPFITVDPEFPITEDAISLIFGGPFTLEARFIPKLPSQISHNYHLRAKGSRGNHDLAITAGKSDDKPYLGIESATGIEGSLLRMEAVLYAPQNRTVPQALIGVDHVFNHWFNVEAEIFYNGFGSVSNYTLAPFEHRSTPYRGFYYLGTRSTVEFTSLLKSTLYTITNLGDLSTLFRLSGNYSLYANVDLELGQYLSVASSGSSEFGGQLPLDSSGVKLGLPNMTYALLKYYF